jgi:glycosyltransferase involved in cell wall biosynthesis
VVNLVRRVVGGRRRQLSVARSHGLEHLAHERLTSGSEEGGRHGNGPGKERRKQRSSPRRDTGVSWTYRFYRGGYRLWECRRSFELADVSLLLNDAERHYVASRFGVASDKIVKVSLGIDDSFAQIARHLLADAKHGHPADMNIAMAGPASFTGGCAYVGEAMTRMLARYPQMKLGLFDTGGTEDSVLAAFPAELRKQIMVVTRCNHNDLPSLLAGFQIFACVSQGERFGVASLEAMACGLVPVVTETAAMPEYIRDGENATVVPGHDAHALETAIHGLIEDHDRWLALRHAALATAVTHSWGNVAARIELVYCQHRQHRQHRQQPMRAG